MATSLSISVTPLAGGSASAQRGYVGYSASKAWVMRYEFTTPSATVTSLTFRTAWYSFNFSSYPVRAQVTTSSTSHANAIASSGYSYIGSAVAETSGSYNVAVHLSGLSLTANTKYYLYLFPNSNYGGNYRHYAFNSSAGQSNYIEVTTHTHSYTLKVTSPTCTAQGYTTHTCSCGNSYVDTYTTALGHNYASATCTKPKTCTRCSATTGSALGHSWDEGVVTTKPTHFATGIKTYTCTRSCGETKTDLIAKLIPTVYIGDDENWNGYQIYIGDGENWNEYVLYIGDGENWNEYC